MVFRVVSHLYAAFIRRQTTHYQQFKDENIEVVMLAVDCFSSSQLIKFCFLSFQVIQQQKCIVKFFKRYRTTKIANHTVLSRTVLHKKLGERICPLNLRESLRYQYDKRVLTCKTLLVSAAQSNFSSPV